MLCLVAEVTMFCLYEVFWEPPSVVSILPLVPAVAAFFVLPLARGHARGVAALDAAGFLVRVHRPYPCPLSCAPHVPYRFLAFVLRPLTFRGRLSRSLRGKI